MRICHFCSVIGKQIVSHIGIVGIIMCNGRYKFRVFDGNYVIVFKVSIRFYNIIPPSMLFAADCAEIKLPRE